jgi:hypothetical protein
MTLFEGGPSYDGAQVFSATKPDRREKLGEAVTDWLQAHPERVPVRVEVRQSSDARFHCLSIVILWRAERSTTAARSSPVELTAP